MGTRNLTVVLNERGKEIANIYGQFDGYPSGQGVKLKLFLDGFVIVNGYTGEDEKRPKCANGMGCLAAQLIAHLKMGDPKRMGLSSSYHIEAPGEREMGEEYIYTIYLPIDNIEEYYKLDWDDEYELVKEGKNYVRKKKVKPKPKLHMKIQSGRMTAFGFPGTPPDQMNILYDGPVEDFDHEKVERR